MGMALPSSLRVQELLAGVVESRASESESVSVLALAKADVTVGGVLSREMLATEVEKEGRSVPSGVWRTPVVWLPLRSV